MNLGVIFNINSNNPEAVIVHDYTNSNVGYSTYNDNLAFIIDNILSNDIYAETSFNDVITYKECCKNSPYYISVINNYLPMPYKILWIKKVNGNINDLLEESYEILN